MRHAALSMTPRYWPPSAEWIGSASPSRPASTASTTCSTATATLFDRDGNHYCVFG